jgi:Na+-translocating ferredoxin:NAD+ oxidoreductase RnfD subunit
VSVVYLNFLSLIVFTLVDIKASIGFLDVAEMLSLVDKDLEPSRVGAPDLHVVGSTSTLDVP